MECGAEQAGESAIKRDRRPKSERGLSERDLEVARRLGLIDRQEESQEACK